MNRADTVQLSKRDWRGELRATLALAWPLMLANLTMQLIQATDVILLGWLGAKELAAAALALSLSFGMILFAMGVLTAASPMIASALGERHNAVRDVRRTFRQSLWAAAIMTVPTLIVLWNAERVILAFGQEPELAILAGRFLRGYMWVIPSWMLFQVMRNFVSALERPGWILVISTVGIPLNALVSWALIFGHFGMPRLGIFGGGIGSAIVWAAMALALATVSSLGVSFLFIAALFQIVDGAQVVGAGMLRGLHDTRVPMIYALFGYWAIGLGVGVALAFAMDWRGIGIWVGLAAGLGVVAVLMLWRWSRRDRLGLLPATA